MTEHLRSWSRRGFVGLLSGASALLAKFLTTPVEAAPLVQLNDFETADLDPSKAISLSEALEKMTLVTVPMTVDTRLFIAPPLCGCMFLITGHWPTPPSFLDPHGRPLTFRHPRPGSLQAIRVEGTCDQHRHFLEAPAEDETLGGTMGGYLHRAPVTADEKLYVAMTRYTGQKHGLSCGCKIYEYFDRSVTNWPLVPRRHPAHTKPCAQHRQEMIYGLHTLAIDPHHRLALT